MMHKEITSEEAQKIVVEAFTKMAECDETVKLSDVAKITYTIYEHLTNDDHKEVRKMFKEIDQDETLTRSKSLSMGVTKMFESLIISMFATFVENNEAINKIVERKVQAQKNAEELLEELNVADA